MTYRSPACTLFALILLAAPPALAQLNPNGSGNPSGISNPSQLQPRTPAPDIAPPALPGSSQPVLATGPNLQKPATGDPTAALFTAVNNADYNAAQDAVSRGADIDAQNSLGETPLDLSIALNHNNITFMLLSARNEGGQGGGAVVPAAMPAAMPAAAAAAGPASHAGVHRLHATPVRMTTAPSRQPAPTSAASDPGTPDPNAGFLGFAPGK